MTRCLQTFQLIALALCACPISESRAVECRTRDGLSLRLDEKTGCVSGIALASRPIPLSAGGRPLVQVREYVAVDRQTVKRMLTVDAEADASLCRPAAMADWNTDKAYVRRLLESGGRTNHVLRIGDGEQPGAGLALADLVNVQPGHILAASWRSRTPDTSLNYIVCWRLYDDLGADVTARVEPPAGWQHSPYSNAHYRVDLRNTEPNTWQDIETDYTVPDGVAQARFSLRVYRGGTLQADVDDLTVDVKPPPGKWTPQMALVAPVTSRNGALVQHAPLPDRSGTVTTRIIALDAAIRVEVALAPDGQTISRCYEFAVSLPLDLREGRWRAAPDRDEPLASEVRDAGAPISVYPLASVGTDNWSLAMARDLGEPGWQTFAATAADLSSTFRFAVSSAAPQARRSFSVLIYRHASAWGFRSALACYYRLLPHLFETALDVAGCWTLRLPSHRTPDVADFGLRFLECGSLDAASRAFCREHGLLTFFYAEPWGLRQVFRDAADIGDIPSYAERLAEVREWAGQTDLELKWRGTPRHLAAGAVLNSFIADATGRAVTQFDKYTHWAAWWQLNTDPDIDQPNRAATCMHYEIAPALAWADGIYLDSLSQKHTTYEDHRTEHLAAANLPLGFSSRAVPVVVSGFAHTEFIVWLREHLRGQNKFLMMNLFPPATRLYGHLGDVTGCELLGNQRDDDAMQQRVYAYQRPVSNLLQWKGAVRHRVPAMTNAEMEDYFQNQLFYGFWPGISTAGGGTEAGYAHIHRYFRDPDLVERDRELFRTYIPVFALLQEAGWEPVTAVRSPSPHIRVERFGMPPGRMFLTVRNVGAADIVTQLELDRSWWARHAGDTHPPECIGILRRAALQVAPNADTIGIPIELAPMQTTVLELRPRGTP